MFPKIRTRRIRTRRLVLATAAAAGAAAFGAVTAACMPGAEGNGDPDPKVGLVALCSNVLVHARSTVNFGSTAKPDIKKIENKIGSSGHDRDPFADDASAGCQNTSGAYGSRVILKAPGLNSGKPWTVTAPEDRNHVLVVRLTQHADGTVTGTKELLRAHN
ncbi:hypothetical protein PH213_38870 [Streptomyces sp. SRF1]|uniref:hypothetical protein n=1 Tax=Streptomyces sp. SRF1 TaxID=1549642 RepID=UPI0025B1FD45|nr:hypothetical protein [Streptomyces sp. SRF1]MDN3060373.1 hypothetical protein [Streptomyces sp. SRF1]